LDSILDNALVISEIKSIEDGTKTDVYDLEVDVHHNYFVNGILSHNSMWENKIYAVKSLYFWIVQFLRRKYNRVEIKFIAHDYYAKELQEKVFFSLISDSGGTRVSAAYELCRDIIKHNYPDSQWNIYCFHASDGDSWEDESDALKLVKEILKLGATLFAYTEINMDNYREGESNILQLFRTKMMVHDEIVVSVIEEMSDILASLEIFLKHSVRQNYI